MNSKDILAASTDLRRVSLFALRPIGESLVATFLKESQTHQIPKRFAKELNLLCQHWVLVLHDPEKRKIWAEEILTLAARLYHIGLLRLQGVPPSA